MGALFERNYEISIDDPLMPSKIVTFAKFYKCEKNEKLYIVGNHKNLGNLDNSQAIQMIKSDIDANVWKINIDLKQNKYFYRFISKNDKNEKILTPYLELHNKYSFFISHSNELNIMSFNLRFDNILDFKNRWQNRKQHVVDIIEKYLPDIIGTQEGLSRQISFLSEKLYIYDYCGCQREM